MKEGSRQAIHILLGISFLLVLNFYSRKALEVGLFSALLLGALATSFMMQGWRIPVLSWVVEKYERKGVRFPGYGSAWYAVGVLMASLFLADAAQLSATICLLAFGDGFSTLVGRKGKARLPYNKSKTAGGTAAFFAFSLISYVFIGPAAIPLAALAAIVESLPIPFDDNLTVPLAAILFFAFL